MEMLSVIGLTFPSVIKMLTASKSDAESPFEVGRPNTVKVWIVYQKKGFGDI